MRTRWLAPALLLASLVAPARIEAAGPLTVAPTGEPYVWDLPITYRTDRGSLGMMTNQQAIDFVESAFDAWASLSTASLSFVNAGLLPVDVDTVSEFNAQEDCSAGDSAIIFDANGSLFAALGFSSGVIGFAGPTCITTVAPFRITKGIAALNGKWRDGNAANGELTADEFLGTFVHEFGHFVNLDHSQTNGQFFIGDTNDPGFVNFGAPLIGHVERMFPFALSGMGSAPRKDDAVAVSTLYPAATFAATTGAITGTIRLVDGLTAFQGADVIARNIADPFADAVSNVSGERFVAGAPAALRGLYELRGLTPAASYTVEVVRVNPQFTGGSGVGPLSTPAQLPGPEEFYSGSDETAGSIFDDPLHFVPVVSVAGVPTTGIDIVFNATLPPGAPFASETLGCDVGCVDVYEVKCLQASRTLHIVLQDTSSDDCFSATLVATSPISMLGAAEAGRSCNTGTALLLTRTTTGEGTMTAFASVYASSSLGGARDYKLTAFCQTGSGVFRNTSLTKKQDQ